MGLWADVNGCKQRKGERKKKKNGLTMGGGHERAVQTVGSGCITSLNTIQTVLGLHTKQCAMFGTRV